MSLLSFNICIVLHILCCNHINFAMHASQEKFDCFSQLLPELQLKSFAHSDNKNNFRCTNKNWAILGSIKNSTLFTQDFCETLYSKEKGKIRLFGILLSAAYNYNYQGLENILNNTAILKQMPYYSLDRYNGKSRVLDLWAVADNQPYDLRYQAYRGNRFPENNEGLLKLLNTYNIPKFPTDVVADGYLGIAIIPCISGDSETIKRFINYNTDVNGIMIEQSLHAAVDFDHRKCLTTVLSAYVIGYKTKITRKIIERAYTQHSMNALEVLLSNPDFFDFDINEITTCSHEQHAGLHQTILDCVIENAARDKWYDELIKTFRTHGAKTAAEVKIMSMGLEQDCTLQ